MSSVLNRVKAPTRPERRRLRVLTQRARILPSFLIIGAQRAGTTTLYYSLRDHREIVGPRASTREAANWSKELHFFDKRFDRGVDWYRSFFPLEARRRLAHLRGRTMLACEATPSYLFHPAVPERVAATLPDVRLIALLRDPVERAYSHYQLNRRRNREDLSFEDAVAAEERRLAGWDEPAIRNPGHRRARRRKHSYLGRGLYADQIERWLSFFPREQLLVVRAEDFLVHPADIYAEVLAFLGVDQWIPKDLVYANKAEYAPIDPELRAALEAWFADSNARLARLLGRDFRWHGPVSSEASRDSKVA
jgi:hypothetical protein